MAKEGKVGSQNQPRKEPMCQEHGKGVKFGRQSMTSGSEGNNGLSGQNTK